MRFHVGQPLAALDFTPLEDGWTPLKEPSPMALNLIGTPIGFLTAALIAMCWGDMSVQIDSSATTSGSLAPLFYAIAIFGIGLPALIAIHELIHAFCYPNFGLNPSTIIVVWPSKLLVLALYVDSLRRNRLLLVYLMPFLVMSLLPLVVCRTLGISGGVLALASIVNGLCCGGDILCFFLILFQVPRHAIVRNQQWATWWKMTGH